MTLNQLFSAINKLQHLNHALLAKAFTEKGFTPEQVEDALDPTTLVYLDILAVCVRYYEHREGPDLPGYPNTIAFFDTLPVSLTSIEMEFEYRVNALESYEFWVKTLRELLRLIMEKNNVGVSIMHLADLFRGMLATDTFNEIIAESDYTPEGCAKALIEPFRYYPGVDAQMDDGLVLYWV